MAELDINEVNAMRKVSYHKAPTRKESYANLICFQALGMAPLPTPATSSSNLQFKPSTTGQAQDEEAGSTLESREAEGENNYRRVQEEEAQKKKREAKREALKKQRDAAQRYAKLEGKGLGDASENDEMDTKSWLISQAKRQKKITKARQRQIEEELRERENQAQYTEKDLAGIKVGHELTDFEAGMEQIITLKDRAVDADNDEEDVLENADLRAREQLKERLESKKRTAVYDPNQDEETGDRKILAQYDDEIDGRKQKKFTLDGMGRTVEELQNQTENASKGPQGQVFSLDFLKEDRPAAGSDYMDISEIKIKKPKKKKKDKSKKQKTADDMFDLGENANPVPEEAMQLGAVLSEAPTNKRRFEENLVIDDDDLQSALVAQRRNALKKRKMTRPGDIARQLREEASATPMETTEDPEEEGGLIIDETSEFVANLQKPEAPAKREIKRESDSPAAATAQASIEDAGDSDVEMDGQTFEDEDAAHATIQTQPKRETSTPAVEKLTTTGLDEESGISQGLGSTLKMLTDRGLLKTAASGDINALHRERQRFLAEKQQREAGALAHAKAQRERDRASGKFERMSAREREEYARHENKARDQFESRQMAEIFNKEYKPNVELNYVDEHGRRMNQKEAFKFLSHQFHGKGSGKQKTEKRIKKIADEKEREGKSSLNVESEAPGLAGVAGQQRTKNRQAGVRLQ